MLAGLFLVCYFRSAKAEHANQLATAYLATQ